MKYDKVRKTPSQLVSLTGFTELEFEAFVPAFEQHWNEYNAHLRLTASHGFESLITVRTARYQ